MGAGRVAMFVRDMHVLERGAGLAHGVAHSDFGGEALAELPEDIEIARGPSASKPSSVLSLSKSAT